MAGLASLAAPNLSPLPASGHRPVATSPSGLLWRVVSDGQVSSHARPRWRTLPPFALNTQRKTVEMDGGLCLPGREAAGSMRRGPDPCKHDQRVAGCAKFAHGTSGHCGGCVGKTPLNVGSLHPRGTVLIPRLRANAGKDPGQDLCTPPRSGESAAGLSSTCCASSPSWTASPATWGSTTAGWSSPARRCVNWCRWSRRRWRGGWSPSGTKTRWKGRD